MNVEQTSRIRQALFYGALLLIGWLLYQIVRPFLVPLAWSAVLAICWWPLHVRLLRRFRPTLSVGAGAGLSTAILSVLLIAPAVLLGIALARQAVGAVDHVQAAFAQGPPEAVRSWWDGLRSWLPLPPFDELATSAGNLARDASGVIARQAGSILGLVLLIVLDVGIVVFALFFMLRDGPAIGAGITRLIPLEPSHRQRLTAEIHDLIHASVTTSVIVAAVQGLLGGALFLILGLEGALFWAVVMGVLSLFPLIGSWLVWAPTAIWLLATGHVAKGTVLIICGVVLISGIDNVLRPVLLGGRSQMGMLHLFISLLGGVAAFGFIGLILGPVVMAVALSLYRAYSIEPVDLPVVSDSNGAR